MKLLCRSMAFTLAFATLPTWAESHLSKRCRAYFDHAATAVHDALSTPTVTLNPIPFLPVSSASLQRLKADFRRYYNMNSRLYYPYNLPQRAPPPRFSLDTVAEVLDENVPGWRQDGLVEIIHTTYGDISLYAVDRRLPHSFLRDTYIVLVDGLVIGAVVPSRQNEPRFISFQ